MRFLICLGLSCLSMWITHLVYQTIMRDPVCVEKSETYEICSSWYCHKRIKNFTRTEGCVTFEDNVVTNVICGNFTIESDPAIKCENKK